MSLHIALAAALAIIGVALFGCALQKEFNLKAASYSYLTVAGAHAALSVIFYCIGSNADAGEVCLMPAVGFTALFGVCQGLMALRAPHLNKL